MTRPRRSAGQSQLPPPEGGVAGAAATGASGPPHGNARPSGPSGPQRAPPLQARFRSSVARAVRCGRIISEPPPLSPLRPRRSRFTGTVEVDERLPPRAGRRNGGERAAHGRLARLVIGPVRDWRGPGRGRPRPGPRRARPRRLELETLARSARARRGWRQVARRRRAGRALPPSGGPVRRHTLRVRPAPPVRRRRLLRRHDGPHALLFDPGFWAGGMPIADE